MSQQPTVEQIARTPVVYTLPGMESVSVTRDLPFRSENGDELTMDLYLPADASADRLRAAVVIVAGYPDPGFERILGCKFKEMGPSISWARLMAASGLAAIVYSNRQPEPDLRALLDHLASRAEDLGIDRGRLGLWASSGNGPLAVSQLLKTNANRPRCTALLYPLLMDLDGAADVAEASAIWRFAHPCAGRSLADIATDVPMLVARAGQDQTRGLNRSLDRFAAAALGANLPFTLINHPTGPHAFDLFDDSLDSHRIVRSVLTFCQSHLMH